MKPSVHEFGAQGIYVISDPKNLERRKRFVDSWGIFDDFSYKFVDAIMGDDIDVDALIKEERLKEFWCGEGAISKNILGCFLSHRSVWEHILKTQERITETSYFLIMEDDAIPTEHFTKEAFTNGEFRKVLKFIERNSVDCFWWGRASEKVSGNYYNKHIKIPDPWQGFGAHAYMVNHSMLLELLKCSYQITHPADVFIDIVCYNDKRYFSPNWSYIRQHSHILHTRFMPFNHPNRIWGSTTQPDWEDYDTRHYDGLYENVAPGFKEYISSAEKKSLENGPTGISFKFNQVSENSLL